MQYSAALQREVPTPQRPQKAVGFWKQEDSWGGDLKPYSVLRMAAVLHVTETSLSVEMTPMHLHVDTKGSSPQTS